MNSTACVPSRNTARSFAPSRWPLRGQATSSHMQCCNRRVAPAWNPGRSHPMPWLTPPLSPRRQLGPPMHDARERR
eukprot:scaffold3052_cov389-Prasinococcus_capsulatus_cf.AAC.10